MADDTNNIKPEAVDAALGDMKLEEDSSVSDTLEVNGNSEAKSLSAEPKVSPLPSLKESMARSSEELTPTSDDEYNKELITGEISLKDEPEKPPKLSRKSSQKVISRPPLLYDHVPNSTIEAVTQFQVIRDCIYGSKHMGSSEHDALGCDCSEDWRDGENHACGEDSDCINRATKMECIDEECNCGSGCQNQRFQRKQFANVSVIKTEKKGYGLRADSDLRAHDFIFEYIGEVINEPTFRRRTIQYDEEGIKHFYFMSLTKSEFVDATKKGNLGRFCNHSCNPNCYVDKWVVGEKLRMGIFAERNIKAGEELVFNYNVDRYGADPQPCYCGEPNCTGFIGGKTQTERATKLSHDTIEALGIDDGDGWDTAVAKRPRKKKTGEDDEEYVNNLQPRSLGEQDVRKVMATLMQCKEKWIAVKLLSRIQRCDDDRVRNCVVQMHGYQILRTSLNAWIDDNNVILQVLDILYKFPRLTRNKIVDSKIEANIESLTKSEHEDVAFEAKRLLEEWSKLELAYRIPRRKPEPLSPESTRVFLRREDRADELSKAVATTPTVAAPTGPRNTVAQRNTSFYALSRPAAMRRPFNQLPPGWFAALDGSGNTYYYSKSGQTTWQRPHLPAVEPPPPPKVPLKAVQNQKALQDIIDSLTKPEPSSQTPKPGTPQHAESVTKDKQKGSEKWRSYSQEKQMKVYENTLFPPIKYVMDKFRHKLPKEDLKKFAKEIAKKLVASDYKHNRVEDPTKITPNQEKKVKKHVKEFFDKAVAKKAMHDRKRVEKQKRAETGINSAKDAIVNDAPDTVIGSETPVKVEESDDMEMSDEEENEQVIPSGPVTPILNTPSDEGLKRKREDLAESFDSTPSETPSKRFKDEDVEAAPSPPPPPPPPPAEDLQMRIDEEAELAAQEEALMRENEEALMLENEEAMKNAELRKEETNILQPGSICDVDARVNGLKKEEDEDISMKGVNGSVIMKMEAGTLDSEHGIKDMPETNGVDEKRDTIQHERKQVLSH